MRRAAHAARMGVGEVYTGFWWGDLRERDHLENLDIDRRKILKWIFKKWNREPSTSSTGLEQGQLAGACKCGNKPAGSIK